MPFFTKSNSHAPNYPDGKGVSVIANFARDGRMKPEKFRFTEQDQSESIINIERIKVVNDYGDRISFICIIFSAGREREIILDYRIYEHVWVLRK